MSKVKTKIYSLSKIQESTDALSKGLIGFEMNLNQSSDTSWQKGKVGLYTFPSPDPNTPDYRTPWIDIIKTADVTTNDTGPIKHLNDPSKLNNPRFDLCDDGGPAGIWCDDSPVPGYWAKGHFAGLRFNCKPNTCCNRFWYTKGDCPDDGSKEYCMRCQYIDASVDDEKGCQDCPGILSACSDPTNSDFTTSCYPYATGFGINTYQNGFIPSICLAATRTHQYWARIPWTNWLIKSNFLGNRTISSTSKDGLPVYGTDYLLAQCNRNYEFIKDTCRGGYCDNGSNYESNVDDGEISQTVAQMAVKGGWVPQYMSNDEIKTPQPGWLRGEWTFPVKTQSQTPITKNCNDCVNTNEMCIDNVCYLQDTLGFVTSAGANSSLSSGAASWSSKVSGPLANPVLPAGHSIGLEYWLADMLTIQDPKVGFLRDYAIIRTFTSAYCATLYGYKSPDGVIKKSPLQVQGNWSVNPDSGLRDLWEAKALLTGGVTSPFQGNLYNPISSSFDCPPPCDRVPFYTQLTKITILPEDVFTVSKNSTVNFTLPIDGFRMKSILKLDSSGIVKGIDSELFQNNILTPLLGSGSITSYKEDPSKPTKINDPLPVIDTSSYSITYNGISYTDSKPFATTVKTSESSYKIPTTPGGSSNFPVEPDNIDKDILWPQKTHAWIQEDGSVGSNDTLMIEGFYYVTVTIKKWNVALAAFYLATVTIPDIDVLKSIQKDTGFLPKVLISAYCKDNLDNCKTQIINNCEKGYSNIDIGLDVRNYFLMYNPADSTGVCTCINSGLVPQAVSPFNNSTAECFDQSCSSTIPGTSLQVGEVLGLTDDFCKTRCDQMQTFLSNLPRNSANLDGKKFNRLCGGRAFDDYGFNTTFFIQLVVPSVILTTIILLFGGMNTPSIIIASLTLVTLVGGAYYLTRLFTPYVRCDGIQPGGKQPLCFSKFNTNMPIHPSFCDINMFCECVVDSDCGGPDCTCKGEVCINKTTKTRKSYEEPVKMINLPMVIFSSAMLVLVPILILGLRKKFFPEISNLLLIGIIAFSVTLFGILLALAIFSYSKNRVQYVKQSCGKN